jgi:hypothetical protein
MSKDDYFNGEDYVTIDSGIKDNNDYPNSNNDVSGSHHEETKENYSSGNSTIQETQITQIPLSISEIKMPFKSLSKFTFFGKKSAKKEDPLNSLAYDYTIPAIEKIEIIDKERIKLEAEDIDRINRLENIDKTIEQAIKNRDQLEKDLEIARMAKDKSNSELIKAEQEFVDNFKTKFALIKQEKTLKKESIVKIEFILSKVDIMNVISLDLSHSDINDFGAKFIADSLVKGDFSCLKSLDVSGNQITKNGTGYFLDALKNSTVGNIVIKQYHLSVFGSKENKVAFMKDYLKQAESKGIDVKNIVVDKSFAGYLKTFGKVCKNAVVGFTKCYYVDDIVTDHVSGKILAKASKTLLSLVNFNDIINCYAESFDESMISPEGVQLIKADLEVMGESTIINAIE